MTLRVVLLQGERLRARLADVARLRIEVFREWPYLYDGDADYERRYLSTFAAAEGATVIAALDHDRMVGAATASPLRHHHADFAAPFEAAGHDVDAWFYLAESVLLPDYRGRGVGVRFFEEREAAAREQGFERTCFCAIARDADHPRRPQGATSLESFWRKRGYAPLEGVVASFAWKEVARNGEVDHKMRFWAKRF